MTDDNLSDLAPDSWSGYPKIKALGPKHFTITDTCVFEEKIDGSQFSFGMIGWPKVMGHRGISASRTTNKMIKSTSYPQYGAPILLAICEHLDWPVPEDDGLRRMTEGKSCEPGCQMGCEDSDGDD